MGKGRGSGGPFGRGPALPFRPGAPALSPAQARLAGLFAAAVQNHQTGRLAEAELCYRQVIAADPNHAETLHNLGILCGQSGRPMDAAALLGRAVAAKPREASFHRNFAVALKTVGRLAEAEAAWRRAIALEPKHAGAYTSLGDLVRDQGKVDEAIALTRKSVALDPNDPQAHNNLGAALQIQDKLTEAEACYRRALALRANFPEAHNNLGDILAHQAKLGPAIASYDRALALRPNYAEAASRRLMWLNYSSDVSAEQLLAEHRNWDVRNASAGPSPIRNHANDRDPERRLKIGYVSGHMRSHPVGFFLAKALEAHDRSAVEVFCYSHGAVIDQVTARLRGLADHWRDIAILPDAQGAAVIAQDRIDILVDLAGHTPGNQLTLFALKPAPVQASWLGYPGTTGVSAVDYLIMDAAAVPPGAERWCSEAVARLPLGRFCYAPPDYAPEPAIPTADRPVTFGSFNHATKIGPEVVALWAEVLKATPGSRLVMKWATLGDPTARQHFVDAFAAAGIAPERLELRGHTPHVEMLAEYADIDIALDPFPFCGGLTSCEAMWMGVPVVTLPGERIASRQTLGFLQAVGLDDLAADSKGDYVRIAAALAADPARRAELRTALRPRMAASPLCDAALFTPTLEAAYRGMWRRWCAGEAPVGFDVPAA